MEAFVFIAALFTSIVFLANWYDKLISLWDNGKNKFIKTIFKLVPLILLVMYVVTTTYLAASDVVSAPVYIIFYIILGFGFTYVTNKLLFIVLNISWIDDSINTNNKAAALLISSLMVGLGLIYSGANIGEGPGFWTVIVASSLGVIALFIILSLLNKITKIIDRIIFDHNFSLSIRLSMLVIALSLIIAKASSGTWTSLNHTFLEFLIFWPSLILLLIASLLETILKRNTNIKISFLVGLFYLSFSVISLFYLSDLIDFVKLLM